MKKTILIATPIALIFASAGLVMSQAKPNPEFEAPEFVDVDVDGETLHVGRHEVSFALWQTCVDARACSEIRQREKDAMDHPVVNVSYFDVQDFLAWYTDATGTPVRLPTQIEWMTLAADHLPMPRAPLFSDPRLAWAADYNINAKLVDKMTSPLMGFGENMYGIGDIEGNVWEWTASTCADDNITGVSDCSAGRIAMGDHVSVMNEFVGDPGNAGCGGGQPPANLGFRMVF